MKHIIPARLPKLVAVITVLLLAARVVSAQTGGGIDLSWHVLTSGGAISAWLVRPAA